MGLFRRIGFFAVIAVVCAFAQQANDYMTVQIPVGAQPANKVLWVRWSGVSRGPGYLPPDSGFIYYDRTPGGADLANYRYRVTVPYVDTIRDIATGEILALDTISNKYYPENPPKRAWAFRPSDQPGMGFGVFFCIVAFPVPGKDTLYSNEFQIFVESPKSVTTLNPHDTISNLTPVFSWESNPGVPYYHVLLSDQLVKVDTVSDSGTISLEGLSIVWQAITPNTQITYGVPDPSRTITADPPPLSPGQVYTWIALNNYGNNAMFSSMRIGSGSLKTFTIKGTQLHKPKSVYPVNKTLNSRDNPQIRFSWTDLDQRANTYKVYLYVGSPINGIEGQVVLWQKEVMASDYEDTMSVEIDAASVMTTNKYTWRVIAIDDRGAGTAGDIVEFNYNVPSGVFRIKTMEQVSVNDTVSSSPVGLVELKAEVLDGSMEAGMLYTDFNGNLVRERPAGTYRLTAIKSEFMPQTQTVVLSENDTTEVTFYLERPQSTIFGGVYDVSGNRINLARVYAVSDLGDSSSALTDASGNFVLRAYGADWNIGAEKAGYKSSFSSKITVAHGESYNFGSIVLERNPFTISGMVENGSGVPLLGVKVTISRYGEKVDEVLSTPQSGFFSFSVPAGEYTISAEKTGFTSYKKAIEVLGPKNDLKITMKAGATLVNGYIYGKTWVGEKEVIAPVTGAAIRFIETGSSDTFSVISDATYGDFKISLPGDKEYQVISSAAGFASGKPRKIKTMIKATQTFKDTLRSLGMLSGTVVSDGSVISGATISLVSAASGEVIATGKSSLQGYFEIRRIPDGDFLIRAGKDGFVLDSIEGPDSLKVSDGKSTPVSAVIHLKPGSKTIKWFVAGSGSFNGSVKIQSPIQKTLSHSDSLTKSGSGAYVVTADAKDNSIIDLASHRFFVADSETVHIDTLQMDVKHKATDTLSLVKGTVRLELISAKDLDSVILYYRDFNSSVYLSRKDNTRSDSYSFNITPPRDGSDMVYYFRAFRGTDIYGYDKETFRTFVKPDTSRLSRFEITPSSQDTMIFPPGYSARFSFRGYYSSVFLPDSSIVPKSIRWTLNNAQGCVLENKEGLEAIVRTGKNASSSAIVLTATIDTNITKVKGTIVSVSVPFQVSGSPLKTVNIKRIDAGHMNALTTSSADQAEFVAEAFDEKGKALRISPAWSITPSVAGKISPDGVFRPDRHFSGNVRIFAEAAGKRGEYIQDGQKERGLNVLFSISHKSSPDTALNGQGCMVVFPPNVVGSKERGKLSIAMEPLKNQVARSYGNFRTVDSLAYEITEMENVSFDLTEDSIELVLDLPESLHKMSAGRQLTIARWDDDSLKWDIVPGSSVSSDGKRISAKITHFSRYAVLVEMKMSGYLKVSPNPFSPYVWPRNISVDKHLGTCIEFQIETAFLPVDAQLRIYNVVGDLVWSLHIQDADRLPYRVWWDGRTTDKDIIWSKPGYTIAEPGKKMCRNGRYLTVLTARDANNSEWKFMKQIVLIK